MRSARELAPFFRLKITLERGLHLLQGLGHTQTRGMQGAPLIVVQDPADRRAVIQDHILGDLVGPEHLGRGCLVLALGTLGLCRWLRGGSDLPFNRSQSPHLTPHLHFGAAVSLEHRLGYIT